MPLLFVHGVNNRSSDCDYFRDQGMRREMFNRLVVPAFQRRFPEFAVLDEVYWGDLGVNYLWGLQSIPPTIVLKSLGPSVETLGPAEPVNPELLALLEEYPPVPIAPAIQPGVEVLGVGRALEHLITAARHAPARLIQAIIAPAKVQPGARPRLPGGEPELTAERRMQCEAEGRDLALVLIAADEAARSKEVADKLRAASDDDEVLAVVKHETSRRYEALSRQRTDALPESSLVLRGDAETLGVPEALAVGQKRIADLVGCARDLTHRGARVLSRGASLVALKSKRDSLTLTAGIFLGDIFEYFRRGQGGPDRIGTIAGRVAKGLRDASRRAQAAGEPLVVVTHSYGGVITYDLLTSPFIASDPALKDINVDLWVTVGSQVGLFAEMRAYVGSPNDRPTDQNPTLGKPARVGTWLNFYDAVDVFSYLAEPVFGEDAVADIEVCEGANLKNAHGAYFTEPSFYGRIAEGLE
jgi:hypothetical protein